MSLIAVNPHDLNLSGLRSALHQAVQSARLAASDGALAAIYERSEMAYVASLFWAQNVAAVRFNLCAPDGSILTEPNAADPDAKPLSLHELMLVRFLSDASLRRCLFALEMSYRFFGRALACRIYNQAGLLRALRYINPLHYHPYIDWPSGELAGFYIARPQAGLERYDSWLRPSDAFYHHGFSFQDDYDGVASAEAAFYDAYSAVDLSIFVRSFFLNHAIPAYHVQRTSDDEGGAWEYRMQSPEGEVAAGDKNALAEFLDRNFKGAANSGRVLVTRGRYEWNALSSAMLKDMGVSELRSGLRESVSLAFQINQEFFIPGQTTYAELQGKIRLWQEMQFLPHISRYAQALTEQIVAPYLPGYSVQPDRASYAYESQEAKEAAINAQLKSARIDLYQAAQMSSAAASPPEWMRGLYYSEIVGGYAPAEAFPDLWRYKLGVPPAQGAAPEEEEVESDAVLLESPSAPQPASLPRALQSELEILMRKAAHGKPFIPDALPLAAALRAYALVEAEKWAGGSGGSPAAFDAAALYLQALAAKALAATEADFTHALQALIAQAVAGQLGAAQFEGRMNELIRQYGVDAYLDGLADGGVHDPALIDDERESIEALLAEQARWIAKLAEAIYRDGRVSPDEVEDKAAMWFNKTIYPFYADGLERAQQDEEDPLLPIGIAPLYAAGIVRGAQDPIMEWRLGATEKHCRSCQALHGQRRRFSLWRATILPKDRRLECRGYRCKCGLYPTNLPESDGALPRWDFLANSRGLLAKPIVGLPLFRVIRLSPDAPSPLSPARRAWQIALEAH